MARAIEKLTALKVDKAKRAGMYGGLTNLAWVVVLILMVWKPS